MKRPILRLSRGAIALVALSCVAVLALALAGYLAQSQQGSRLSKRTYAASVSSQLAEMGLEEALRGFNTNNFADWTIGTSPDQTAADWTINGTTATATITLPADKYGTTGITGSVKLRVDNYNAYNLPATWSSSVSYRLNDVVGYSGMWYRCVLSHSTTQTPTPTGNLVYWVPVPIPWTWSSNTAYSLYEAVNYNGTWYRCTTAHTNSVPPSANWAWIPTLSMTWSSTTAYAVGSFANRLGTWYRCISASTNNAPPNATYWSAATGTSAISFGWRNLATYKFNDVVFYGNPGTWYRCILGHTVSASSPIPTNTTYWENALSTSWNWSSAANYNIGDVVYNSGSFYRCIVAHRNQTPAAGTYWSTSPLLETEWDPGKLYGSNDVVFYNGNWHLSLQSSNAGNNPVAIDDWVSTRTYVVGNIVNRSGTWYRCILTSTNNSPPNATYWTSTSTRPWAIAPRSIAAWDASKTYSIDDLVSSGGAWYRCISNHTNQSVAGTSYWTPLTGSAYQWSSTTSYTTSSYVNYGGAWYKCNTAHSNKVPSNSSYWDSSWAQSYGATTGVPVIFAEGKATMSDGSILTTQLRAPVSRSSLLPNAIGATGVITIGGAGTVDSYDGNTASVNAGGVYTNYAYNQSSTPFTTSANLGYSATIASSYTGGTAIAGGTTTVQGYLAAPSASSAPYAPSSTFTGTVKGTSAGTGIDLTRLSRSPYVPQFEIKTAISHTALPNTLPTPDLYLGTPGSPTPSIYYNSASPTIGTNIYINGPVVWYINGNLRVNSGDVIYINSTGFLTIYITNNSTGRLRIESTGGGIINRSPSSTNPNPRNLVIIGDTTSNTTQYYSHTTNPFYGVIYLPNTTEASGLTIANGTTIYGALSAKKITFSGAADLHYDTSLRYAKFQGVDIPYQLNEVRELTNSLERVTLP